MRLDALERVGAMPGQGGASMFRFGRTVGEWRGILTGLGIPTLEPTPREWQAGLVRKSEADPKARALAVARRLFPGADLSRKKIMAEPTRSCSRGGCVGSGWQSATKQTKTTLKNVGNCVFDFASGPAGIGPELFDRPRYLTWMYRLPSSRTIPCAMSFCTLAPPFLN